jgi:ribosomal protein S18 acetylase RimI-like enzyme
MITDIDITCHDVREADRQRLANLIHFEPYIHRHLDWRAPLDWIGRQPFLTAEIGGRLVGAVACPPDPPGVAWIRLFAIAAGNEASFIWHKLWSVVLESIDNQGVDFIGAIPLQNWFKNLLMSSGFEQINEVILMTWTPEHRPITHPDSNSYLRPMNIDDLSEIEDLDRRSFGPIWHNSKETLELAYRQAAVATVAEFEDQIYGYQISTALQKGGHLARLAVEPGFQRKGIGGALLADLLTQFRRRGATNVTVNTQSDNQASIALYERFGFKKTGEAYPVFQYHS